MSFRTATRLAEPAQAFPPPERVLRKVKGQGVERRAEILDCAQRLFASHGVHSVSTRAIAEAVGISQPTLYSYFPRKTDILHEVCERAFVTLKLTAQSARGDASADPLERMIRSYIAFGLREPDAYRIAFMMEGLFTEEERAAFADAPKPGLEAYAALRAIFEARLGADNPELDLAAQSLWAAMHGLVSLLLARCGFPWAEREALVDWHVAALLRGVPAPVAN